jgi:alkylation response protein AidB-like acyl-CoA dehydrogenase
MEFAFSPEAEAFREEIQAFLRQHPPESFPEDGMDAGYGSGAHSHAFLKALGEHGWLTMTWPRAFGGQERPMVYKLVLVEELASAGAPFEPMRLKLSTDRCRNINGFRWLTHALT